MKDVRANCFCASLLRTQFTRHVMNASSARQGIQRTMTGQMAIATTLPGLNDLGLSFFGCILFLVPIFYVLRKSEENLSNRSLNF